MQIVSLRRPVRSAALRVGAISLLLLAFVAPPASASKLTNIIDSFERGEGRSVDFTFAFGWEMWKRSGNIRREFRCISHDNADYDGVSISDFCPTGSKILDRNELTTERVWHQLNIDMQLGFWRIAEIHLRLPIILLDQTKLGYYDGVGPTNTSVDPHNRPSLFTMPNGGQFVGAERAGVGDLLFGFRFAPLSYSRDITRPNWTIGLDIMFPTAEVKKANKTSAIGSKDENTGVGDGLWKLHLATAISSRFVDVVEPYFQVAGTFAIPAGNSLYKDYGKTQTLISPGHMLHLALGVEFVPYEDREDETSFIIDLGAGIDFKFEGREYSDLFEVLGGSDCDPSTNACELTTFTRGDIDGDTGQRRKTDGITDYEQYATIKGWLGFRWQMYKHIQLQFNAWLGHETTHFITTADAGKDLDNHNQVEALNSNGENEYNPVYNDAYDSLGSRFRTGDTLLWGLGTTLMGKF